MGRKHRNKKTVALATSAAVAVGTTAARPVATEHAFDAAKRMSYKGYFWFPSLEPREQMPEMTRDEVSRKINWLYNNVGAVRAAIDGIALDEVDTGLWPKPATKSPNFNRAVKTRWDQQCGFHKAFDAAGENNFYSIQFQIRREIGLRGGCFGAKLRRGEAASCPQLHLMPDWQCANARTELDQKLWRDGRMDNRFGRALKYRFLKTPDRKQFVDMDAADVIHFHDPFLIGQTRGMSPLAPVVRKLFSIDDIERAESSGVQLRSRIAYAVERVDPNDDAPSMKLPGTREVVEEEQEDGSVIKVQRVRAMDGSEVEVFDSKSRKLKIIESAKSSESGSWIKELLADVAYARGYPPEYIFSLAGLTQGTLVRMAQQKVQRVLNTVRDFQLILQLIEEWWPFWLWQNIESGYFESVGVAVPEEWWPYRVVRPKDLTVDQGREGRLYDERFASGKMPAGLYIGMIYGEDEEEVEDEIIRDAYRRRRRNAEIAAEQGEDVIPVDQIFRPPAGVAPALAEVAPEEKEEKEEKKVDDVD